MFRRQVAHLDLCFDEFKSANSQRKGSHTTCSSNHAAGSISELCLVQGNAAFKTGDFVGAIGHYTDAHLADRLEPTYPLNRAAAYLKLGKCAF